MREHNLFQSTLFENILFEIECALFFSFYFIFSIKQNKPYMRTHSISEHILFENTLFTLAVCAQRQKENQC
jgi:hypothetical protein